MARVNPASFSFASAGLARPSEAVRRLDGALVGWRDWDLWLLAASVAYIAVPTDDLRVGSLPFKVPVVAAALVAWLLVRRRDVALADFRSARLLLVVGIAVPLAWSAWAVVNDLVGDTATDFGASNTLQHASRFGYLLLYFPLVDAARRLGPARAFAWCLAPVFALVAVTWGLWAGAELFGGNYLGTTHVLVFRGIFSELSDGTARIFIANQILLIPAFGYLIARLAFDGSTWARLVGVLAFVTGAFLSHTRGVWLGMVVAAAAVVVLALPRVQRRYALLTPSFAWVLAVLAALAIGTSLMLVGDVRLPGALSDASARERVDQAPELWHAVKHDPVLGGGLGTTLASGFARSSANPWSFELTYLEALFQMGVVGVLFLLSIPASALARTLRELSSNRAAAAVGASAGLTGIYAASATNPYLFSAFGMLGVAFAMAVLDAPGEWSEQDGRQA